MPVLALNQPIEQRSATLVVENKLGVGKHRFALVVVNSRGVESEADVFTVSVRRVPTVGPDLPSVIGDIDTRIDTRIGTRVPTPVVNPVIRPRGGARKGKHHGPE